MRGEYKGPAPVPRERGHYRDESPCACGGTVRIRIATACAPVPGATTYRCDSCGKDGRFVAGGESPAPMQVRRQAARPPRTMCARRGCQVTVPVARVGSAGRAPKFCSETCRKRHNEQQRRDRRRAELLAQPRVRTQPCDCGCGQIIVQDQSKGGRPRTTFNNGCRKRIARRSQRFA